VTSLLLIFEVGFSSTACWIVGDPRNDLVGGRPCPSGPELAGRPIAQQCGLDNEFGPLLDRALEAALKPLRLGDFIPLSPT
jgi:hypothetical protein